MDIKQIKEKVLGFIKIIPADKKKHFIAGFIVCAIVSMFFGYIIGFISALVVAGGKEASDYFTKKGMPELADFIYSAVGAVCFLIVSAFITLLFYAFVMRSI